MKEGIYPVWMGLENCAVWVGDQGKECFDIVRAEHSYPSPSAAATFD